VTSLIAIHRGAVRVADCGFLTELCPIWLGRPIGIAIELLAGIPSMSTASGSVVFALFLQGTLQLPD
jgi:phosphate transport system permease protein